MPAPERTIGSVPGAPTPYLNAYSLVVRSAGDRIHLAGMMGDDAETGDIVEGGCEAQADQVMSNIKACLEAAGSSLDKIVCRRSYYMDIKKDAATVVAVWSRWVPGTPPVSTAIQVSGLAKEGAVIEIEVEAEA